MPEPEIIPAPESPKSTGAAPLPESKPALVIEMPEGVTSIKKPETEPTGQTVNTAVDSPKNPDIPAPITKPGLPEGVGAATGAGAPTKIIPIVGPAKNAPGAAAIPVSSATPVIPRPTRAIATASDAAKGAKGTSKPSRVGVDQGSAVSGVAFVKNRRNEIVVLPDGSTYLFRKSKEFVTDPAVIKGLRQVAAKYDIFEDEPEQ